MSSMIINPFQLASGGPPPFSPADIAGLKLWLDAGQIVGLSDGDPLATWTDLSGNGNDATQATGAAKPTYKTGILNSKAVVRFDGVDDYLRANLIYAGTQLTVFIVAKRISIVANAGNAIFGDGNPAHNDYMSPSFVLAYSDNGSELKTYSNGPLSAATHPGNETPYLFATKFDGANNTSYLNGSAQTPAAFSTTLGFAYCYLGSRFEGGSLSSRDHFDVAEFLFYDSALSDADREKVETCLNDKYAIF